MSTSLFMNIQATLLNGTGSFHPGGSDPGRSDGRKEAEACRHKAFLPICLCLMVGSTAYLSVVTTETLLPKATETAVDPEMNGYYENIEADNGDIYTGEFAAGYYDGTGKVLYPDGFTQPVKRQRHLYHQ